MTPLEYRDMTEYVGQITKPLLSAIEGMRHDFQQHESWHRETLERQIASTHADLWQRRLAVIGAGGAVVSAAGIIATLVHLHGGG